MAQGEGWTDWTNGYFHKPEKKYSPPTLFSRQHPTAWSTASLPEQLYKITHELDDVHKTHTVGCQSPSEYWLGISQLLDNPLFSMN